MYYTTICRIEEKASVSISLNVGQEFSKIQHEFIMQTVNEVRRNENILNL